MQNLFFSEFFLKNERRGQATFHTVCVCVCFCVCFCVCVCACEIRSYPYYSSISIYLQVLPHSPFLSSLLLLPAVLADPVSGWSSGVAAMTRWTWVRSHIAASSPILTLSSLKTQVHEHMHTFTHTHSHTHTRRHTHTHTR